MSLSVKNAWRKFRGEKVSNPVTDEVASSGTDFLRKWAGSGIIDTEDEIIKTIAPSRIKVAGDGSVFDAYTLYKVMRTRDTKFKALIGTRKRALLSKEIRIVPNPYDPDEDRARDAAEFMQAVIDQIENFRRDMREMLDAIPVGFSVSELIWEERDIIYGRGKRKAWVVTDLRQRRTGRFGFTKEGELRYIPEPGQDVGVPPMKFLVCSHEPEFEDPRGLCECSEVFWYWYFKHQTIRDKMVFHDKYGMPTATATYPSGADKKMQRDLLQLLQKIQTEYAMVLPKNVEIKLIEAQRNGAATTFQTSIDYWDRCMSEALTGQSLATSEATTGIGARAMSETHNEVRQEVLEADSEELEGWINTQFMRWHIDLNFGVDVPAPRLVIASQTKNLNAEADLDGKLVALGLPLSKREMYERYGKTPPEDEEDVLGLAKAEFDVDESVEDPKDEAEAEDEVEADEAETEDDNTDDADEETVEQQAGRGRVLKFQVVKEARTEHDRQRDEFELVLGRITERGIKAFQDDLITRLDAAAEEAESLEDLDTAVFNMLLALSHPWENITAAITAAKLGGYLLGAGQIQRYHDEVVEEDPELNQEAGKARRFDLSKILADYEPLDPAKALEWWEGLTPLTSDELETLPQQAEGAAFTVAEIESRSVLERIQREIADYLAKGKSLQEWKSEFPDLLQELGVAGVEPHRIDEIFRTNTSRAYGAGRTRALRDPEIEGAFPMWQRIAVMDDRTRDTHRAMDAFVALADDPIWLSWNAPNDYNCRCDVLPLTRRQIEMNGIEVTLSVEMPDGTEVDPRNLPVNPAFRGLGFN